MKLFVMSDIHGDYLAMMEGLKNAEYDCTNLNHQLIVIGDYFGRATTDEGAYGVFKYLTSDEHKNKPICLLGNHEEIFVRDMLTKGYISYMDERNGEDKTIYSFYEHIPNIDDPRTMKPIYDELQKNSAEEDRWSQNLGKGLVLAINKLGEGKQLLEWVNSLPYYYETKHYVFTHGWLPYRVERKVKFSNKADDHESFEAYLAEYPKHTKLVYDYKHKSAKCWHDWLWTETPKNYELHTLLLPHGWKKWIVVGHWHAFAFGEKAKLYTEYELYDNLDEADYNYVIDNKHKVIFCDHCTALGHKINVLVLEDELLD